MKKTVIRSFALLLVLTMLLAGCASGSQTPEETGPVGEIFNDYGDSDTLYLNLAKLAVDDLLANFWVGDLETGHFLPTHGGIQKADMPKGVIWEAAIRAYCVYDLWVITKDVKYENVLKAQAKWMQENYLSAALENPAGAPGPASDDCAWSAMLYLCLYEVTQDTWFVDRTVALLDNCVARWYDEELGGLYYSDGVDVMSLYECGMTHSWLRLWELKGDQRFYDLALRSYENMHKRLVRPDGIYYNECNKYWPMGDMNAISEGGSSSSLFGNMAMAALSARFYEITGEQKYLDRVYATNEGLLQWYDVEGVLMNDRDAWTNCTFASYYASHVLTLPGTEKMQALVKSTAESIMRNSRTESGCYGGAWHGPAEGDGSVWHLKGSVATQAHTSGNTVLMVTAAAMLEAGITDFTR